MRIDILTVVPELLTSPLNESILKRAQQKASSKSQSTTYTTMPTTNAKRRTTIRSAEKQAWS